METVVIERQLGQRETCHYLARDPREADEKLRFYAEIKGQWRVVTLEAVRPQGARFRNDAGDIVPSPFSDSPPKEITPCRLCPPPCCAAQAEAKQRHPDDWQECLWVSPEQERRGGTLRSMLARLRQAARAARRGQEFPFFPAYEFQLPASYGKRRLTAEFPFEREYCGRIEKMTVADFKQGHWQGRANFTRDAFLVAEWVKRDRVDTAQMDGDAKTCFGWMSAQNWHDHDASSLFRGCEADILEDEWEPYFQSVADKFLSAHYGKDYRTMFRYRRSVFAALLARVRYKVTFRNDAVLYLKGLEARAMRSSELAEVGSLRPRRDDAEADTARVVRQVLEEMKPLPIEREIIFLWYNMGESADSIVEKLRAQKRGKAKGYVLGVIATWRRRMAAHGIETKRGGASNTESSPVGFDDDGRVVPTAKESASRKLDLEDIKSFLEKWPKFSEEDRQQLLDEYPELRRHLRRGRLDCETAMRVVTQELSAIAEPD